MLVNNVDWQNSTIIEYLKDHIEHGDPPLDVAVEDGKRLNITSRDKTMAIILGEMRGSDPFGIDILLTIPDGSVYVIYVLEINDDILVATLEDICLITKAFFNEEYTLYDKKSFFKKTRYLKLSPPIVNNVAGMTKSPKLPSA